MIMRGGAVWSFSFRPHLDLRFSSEIRETALLMLPKMLQIGMWQIMLWWFIMLATRSGEGGVTIYNFAYNFQSVPVSLIGVAIGFGAQSLIKDFLSGIFIIVENQYRVGDIVDIEGAAGTVERVTIRSTVLRDTSGNVHFMPNGEVLHVINKTMGYSRVNFSLTVDPDTDVDRLVEIIDEVGVKLSEDENWKDKILEAPHFLNIGTFSDVALEVTITGKTTPSQQWSVTGEMRRRLLKAFAKHHIVLAHVPGITGLDTKK